MKRILIIMALMSSILTANSLQKADEAYAKGNYVVAAEILQAECNKGTFMACHNLGLMYLNGDGVDLNLNQSFKMFDRACKGSVVESCFNLGILYEKSGDFFNAFKFYQKACDMGNLSGCESLAYLYENGLGTRQDFKKAANLYENLCQKGVDRGCVNLAKFLINTKGDKKRHKKGLGAIL